MSGREPLWLPFNVFRTSGGGLLAFEAHLWSKLSTPVRRPLLILPASGLSGSPGRPCALRPLVAPEKQLEDLEDVARGFRVSVVPRLLSLVAPSRLLGAGEPDPMESMQAAALAREILAMNPRPLGRVAWAPLSDAAVRRRLGYVASRDPRLHSYIKAAEEACSEMGGELSAGKG